MQKYYLIDSFQRHLIIYARYTTLTERLARETNESSLSNMEDNRKETSMPAIQKAQPGTEKLFQNFPAFRKGHGCIPMPHSHSEL